MQVTRATFIPLLAAGNSDRLDPGAVRDEYSADLTVVYTFGPQFGRRVVTHADLEQMEIPARALRRSAFEHLEVLSSRAEFHGQPPALMLSFEGLESSLLLASDFWTRLQGAVPGDVVVGVPARDVVVVTGSQSVPGLEKARRCVERVFMAGGDNPLTQNLLVRRGGTWEPFDRPVRRSGRPNPGAAHQLGLGQPPRQYQEHPSWPGERVPPVSQRRSASPPGARPAEQHSIDRAASLPPRAAANTLPPVAGNLGPGGPAANPMSATGLGVPPVPAQTSRQRPMPGRRSVDRHQHPADVAPHSSVPYSSVPYSSVPYSSVPYSAVPQSPMSQSARSQSAAAQAAAPYSAVPYSAVPYSAMPYSAVPYSAVPNSAAQGQYSRPDARPHARPGSHREPVSQNDSGPRTGRSRGPQSTAPWYTEDAKPAYRDEPRRSDRYRDDLHSTGTHAGPPYPSHAPASSVPAPAAYPQTPHGEDYDHQPDVPEPNYPGSWGWVPESSSSIRPLPQRPASPRDRFSR